MMLLKVTKKQGLTISLEDTLFEKPQGGRVATRYISPHFPKILINTYRNPSRLIIDSGKEILSQDRTAQGDNLAMSLYALITLLVQNSLRSTSPIKQVWLADDATGASVKLLH